MPEPKMWPTLGVSPTDLVERRHLFFFEAEVLDNIFQFDVLKNIKYVGDK